MKKRIYLTTMLGLASLGISSFAAEKVSPVTSEFEVKGSCEMCKMRIEKAARSVKGVKSAKWNGAEQQLQIKFDSTRTNTDLVKKAIALKGHDTDLHKAADTVYDALPGCCHYRH